MDLALAVEQLLPSALYHQFDTYEHLVATWFDPRPIPTEQALQTAWNAYLADKAQKDILAAGDSAKVAAAKLNAKNIPNWATWDEATALAWFDPKLNDAGVDAIASLAAAKPILKDLITVNRALIRMVIALRDNSWPDLNR